MELQENGLPIGAEFGGLLRPQKGQYFVQEGDCVIATDDWEHLIKVIIEFPTYGMPPHQVHLKGRKLLGGNMTKALGCLVMGMDYVAAGGSIKTAIGGENGDFIRLEPLPKKKRVLVLELPILVGGNVKLDCGGFTGSMYFDAEKFARNNGGIIKEVDDDY